MPRTTGEVGARRARIGVWELFGQHLREQRSVRKNPRTYLTSSPFPGHHLQSVRPGLQVTALGDFSARQAEWEWRPHLQELIVLEACEFP